MPPEIQRKLKELREAKARREQAAKTEPPVTETTSEYDDGTVQVEEEGRFSRGFKPVLSSVEKC